MALVLALALVLNAAKFRVYRDQAHTACAKSMDLSGEDEEDEAQDEQGVEARCSGHGACRI